MSPLHPASQGSGVALQQFQTQSQGVAAGYVSDSRSRISTTRSGISGGELVITDEAAQQERTGQSIEETLAAVNREVLSSTEANGLSQRWDGQKLQKQVQAGAQIVATFGQQASKAVGDYAGRKAEELRTQGQEEEARKWDEGGAYRVAAHIAVGGLSGGLEGALGSGSSAAAVPHLAEAINAAGLPEPVRQAVIAATGAAVGALTGGTTGAATGFNQTANNYLLHEEQLARSQADQACRSGDAQACQTRERLDQLSQTRQAALSHSCLDGSAAQCRANLSLLSQDYLALQASAQDLAARIAASTDPREVEALKALQKQNQTHLKQVAGLLKTNLGEIDQNKGGLTPAEKIVLASLHADTSGREITEALIGAAILGKKAADRLAGVTGGSSGAKPPSADATQVEQQKIENNVYRDGSIADPAQPMSATGPWTPAAAMTPTQAQEAIQAALPAGVRVIGNQSADALNAADIAKGRSPSYVPGSSVLDVTTTQTTSFVRVYVDGGQSGPAGGWIMRAEDIQGLTPQQIASKYALPEVPNMMVDVRIPAGTRLSVSVANGISPHAAVTGTRTGDNGGGGGVQFQIKSSFNETEFRSLFSNPRPLPIKEGR